MDIALAQFGQQTANNVGENPQAIDPLATADNTGQNVEHADTVDNQTGDQSTMDNRIVRQPTVENQPVNSNNNINVDAQSMS